jgi:hypothetical protein
MKQLSKRIVFLLFFCATTFLYFSCTQEKEFVNEHNHSKIDFKEKSFKEALSLPLFNDALKKVAKQKGILRSEDAARTALEDQYGFTIVADAPVRIVTDENGTIFYTILIEREVKEELVFENLMIKVEDDETAAAILKYTMEEKGTQSETGEHIITGITDTEYTDLNVEGKMFFNGNGDTCFDINVVLCNFADTRPAGHIATASCWYHFNNAQNASNIYYSTEVLCMNDGFVIGGGGGDTGGTGGTDGSSNNTGGVGASGGDPEPIIVSPIPCRTGNCIEADVVVDPCEKLTTLNNAKKISTITPATTVLDYLNDLNNTVVTDTREKCYYFFPSPTEGELLANYEESSLYGDDLNISLYVDYKIELIIHTHYGINQLQVFSLADIYQVYDFLKNNHISDADTFTSYLITTYGTVLALNITDKAAFLTWGNTFFYQFDSPEELIRRTKVKGKEDVYEEKVSLKNTANQNKLGLAQFLQKQNIGVQLATCTSNFNKWSKYSVDPITGVVTLVPCPNP